MSIPQTGPDYPTREEMAGTPMTNLDAMQKHCAEMARQHPERAEAWGRQSASFAFNNRPAPKRRRMKLNGMWTY